MPRIEVIRADKNTLKWVDSDTRPLSEGFRLFRDETLELRVSMFDTLTSDTDLSGKLYKIGIKDPANLAGDYLAETTDITAAFTDLAAGDIGFLLVAASSAIDTFISASECEKQGVAEIIEIDGTGAEVQIIAHDNCRVMPDLNRGTETTTTTTT